MQLIEFLGTCCFDRESIVFEEFILTFTKLLIDLEAEVRSLWIVLFEHYSVLHNLNLSLRPDGCVFERRRVQFFEIIVFRSYHTNDYLDI